MRAEVNASIVQLDRLADRVAERRIRMLCKPCSPVSSARTASSSLRTVHRSRSRSSGNSGCKSRGITHLDYSLDSTVERCLTLTGSDHDGDSPLDVETTRNRQRSVPRTHLQHTGAALLHGTSLGSGPEHPLRRIDFNYRQRQSPVYPLNASSILCSARSTIPRQVLYDIVVNHTVPPRCSTFRGPTSTVSALPALSLCQYA